MLAAGLAWLSGCTSLLMAALSSSSAAARRLTACVRWSYCGSTCQKRDWTAGGHRLVCVASGRRAAPPCGREALEALDVAPW
jgi:hypothetical protein